jgi:hypothetical protein
VRLVSRSPRPIGTAELFPADLSDAEQAIRAVAGSSTVHLLVGLKYSLPVWQDLWPRIMANTIEACKRANARLVFFDNVYMYGKVSGPMTEDTPYAPGSRKGEIRARIATTLMDEIHTGPSRAADFYGPRNKHSVPNILVFEPLSAGSTPFWLVNPDVPHSFTFIPDAARGLAMLTATESAWNQVWHLPTAPTPLTGKLRNNTVWSFREGAAGFSRRYKASGTTRLSRGCFAAHLSSVSGSPTASAADLITSRDWPNTHPAPAASATPDGPSPRPVRSARPVLPRVP